MKNLLLILLLGTCLTTKGQTRDTTKYIVVHKISQLGDSIYIQNVRTDILEKCEIITNSKNSVINLTAPKDFSKTYEKGTLIQVLSNDTTVTRISVEKSFKKGEFTATYFYWGDRLIRIKEKFVSANKSPSWEFQTFWKQGELQDIVTNLKQIQTGKYKWDTNYSDMTNDQIDLISELEKYLFIATSNPFFKRFEK